MKELKILFLTFLCIFMSPILAEKDESDAETSNGLTVQADQIEKKIIGTWNVKRTAPYVKEAGLEYTRLILRKDLTYELHLINNADKYVEIHGRYRLSGNEIDFRIMKMLFDGKKQHVSPQWQEGTVYLVDGKLYFNIMDFAPKNKKRLDAMEDEFRNVGVRAD